MNYEQISVLAKTGLAGLGAGIGYVFGEWTVLLQVLTFMIIADYFTGLIAGFVEGGLSSKTGFKGIAKKVAILVFVAVGHFIDLALGKGSMVMDSVIVFYIGNELISLIENGGRVGLPIPEVLKRSVDIFKSKAGSTATETKEDV